MPFKKMRDPFSETKSGMGLARKILFIFFSLCIILLVVARVTKIFGKKAMEISFSVEQLRGKTKCERRGGVWEVRGFPSNPPSCFTKTIDAGKKCIDSSQCQSVCIISFEYYKKYQGCVRSIINRERCDEWPYPENRTCAEKAHFACKQQYGQAYGSCYAWDNPAGECFTEVENGRVGTTQCID